VYGAQLSRGRESNEKMEKRINLSAVENVFLSDKEEMISEGITQVPYPLPWRSHGELELMDEPDEDAPEPKDDFSEDENDQLNHD